MANIPLYDAPQEQLRPLGSPDLHSVASPEVLGGAARNTERMGASLSDAGAGLADVAYRLKQRDDADSIFRAETALKDTWLKTEQDYRQNKQGRFAKGLTQDMAKFFDGETNKQIGSLANENQKRLFTQRAASYRQQALAAASNWETSQLNRSEDDSYKATQASTVGVAVSAGTPAAVDTARDELRRKVIAHGALRGWTPEIVQAETNARLTDLHMQMLQGLAQSNPAQAEKYFETFKDEIDGTKHAELAKFSQQATANALGERAADEIWTAKGPKTDNAATNLDELEAQTRDALKGNDFARKAAIAALRERAAVFDKSVRDRQSVAMDRLLVRIVEPNQANGGAVSDREILADGTLTALQKEHLIDYRARRVHEVSQAQEAKTNPAEVRRLMLDIHAADGDPKKAYNADGVMESYRAGKISTTEMRMLRGEVEQLRDGNTQGFQKDVQNARNAVYTALTRSVMGQVQPEVAADAAYRFTRDLDIAVAKKRKANEDPRALLTPGSKDYMLSPERIHSYMQPGRAVLADEAKRVVRREARGKIGGPPSVAPKALPTYLDYTSLKSGDRYIDPQGNTRQKK